MNGSTCCAEALGGAGLSITGVKLPGAPGTSGGVLPGGAPGTGVLDKIAAAFDAAVHGTGVSSRAGVGGASGGGNVIDFPMVNPYRPIIKTRSPIAGLNAFPSPVTNFSQRKTSNFYKRDVMFNAAGERDADADGMPDGATSLGFFDPGENIPAGVSLPSGPSNLSVILGAITQGLATVPAIISARKKQPYYDPSAGQYGQYGQGGVTGGGVADIGARTGAAVGNLGDTFGQIVAQHPYLILAGGAALVLLFMSPPRRR